MMMSPVSVSPLFMMTTTPTAADKADLSPVEVKLECDDVVDLRNAAVLGDPVAGKDVVTLDERGPGALVARALPSPKQPHQPK